MTSNLAGDHSMRVEYRVDYDGRRVDREWTARVKKPGARGSVCCDLEPRARGVTVTLTTLLKGRRPFQSNPQVFRFETGDGVDAFFNFQGHFLFAYDFGRDASETPKAWEVWDHGSPEMRVDQLGFQHPPRKWAGFLASAELWNGPEADADWVVIGTNGEGSPAEHVYDHEQVL